MKIQTVWNEDDHFLVKLETGQTYKYFKAGMTEAGIKLLTSLAEKPNGKERANKLVLKGPVADEQN